MVHTLMLLGWWSVSLYDFSSKIYNHIFVDVVVYRRWYWLILYLISYR